MKKYKSTMLLIIISILISNIGYNQKMINAIQFSGTGVCSSGWQTRIPYDNEIATRPYIQNITSAIDNTTLESTNVLWQIIDYQGNLHISWNVSDYFYRNYVEENILQYNVTVWINQSIPFNVDIHFFSTVGYLIPLNGTLINTEESQILSLSSFILIIPISLLLLMTISKRKK